MFTLRKQKPAV